MNRKKNLLNCLKGILVIVLSVLATGQLTADPEKGEGRDENHFQMHDNIKMNTEVDASKLNGIFRSISDGDTVVVRSTGTDLSYDVTEIRAKAGSTLTIRYENTSDMPHNIVIVTERSAIQQVGIAGIQARETDYVPQDDAIQEKIIGYTKLAKPGDTVFLTMTVPPPGTYPYICTYPGHFTMMQGDLISEE